jgi:hypothetical protein
VIGRKPHARIVDVRHSESKRVAKDLLHGYFWGLISRGESADSGTYGTQISEYATVTYYVPRAAISSMLVQTSFGDLAVHPEILPKCIFFT